MSTIHLVGEHRLAYVKGAAEVLVPQTTLPPDEQASARRRSRDGALRVAGARLRRRVLPDGDEEQDDLERELEFLGLAGMLDPPRPEVSEAIARCRAAGIRVLMVTGDSGNTVEAVARRIGLVQDAAHVIGPGDLDALDDEALRERLAERDVIFARISAEQKLRLARVLRAAGEIVAMTGDGVNDAPGAQGGRHRGRDGRSGTDVARETADMVLLDDNFASIVAAVEEGRRSTPTSGASRPTTSARTSASSSRSSPGVPRAARSRCR